MPLIDGRIHELDESKGVLREARPLIRNVKDGSIMVLVSGGEFEMGDGKKEDCPKRRVYVDAYYIGVFCVTNRQYAMFVKEKRYRAPDKADEKEGDTVWKDGRCPEAKLDYPVVCVSWDDAKSYANWAGAILPTEAQWEMAVRWMNGLIYPWGDGWDASHCRNKSNKGNKKTAMVWKYPGGTSGYGTYQQSGNVWEWCADWYGKYEIDGVQKNPLGSASGSYRVLRGGSWWHGDPLDFRAADRSYGDSAYRSDALGFRLAKAI